jgi:hypothetical protein
MFLSSQVDLSTQRASSKLLADKQDEFDVPADPNEPVYCFCQKISYGEMVACDNDEVRVCSRLVASVLSSKRYCGGWCVRMFIYPLVAVVFYLQLHY